MSEKIMLDALSTIAYGSVSFSSGAPKLLPIVVDYDTSPKWISQKSGKQHEIAEYLCIMTC